MGHRGLAKAAQDSPFGAGQYPGPVESQPDRDRHERQRHPYRPGHGDAGAELIVQHHRGSYQDHQLDGSEGYVARQLQPTAQKADGRQVEHQGHAGHGDPHREQCCPLG